MTILTETARREVLTKVLKEAFEPKFADLQKRLVQYAKEWLHTNHPLFEELLARKDVREYLNTTCYYRIYIGDVVLYYPSYGIDFRGAYIRVNEISVPAQHADRLEVSSVEIYAEYNFLWDAYKAAHSELFKVLASYKTHEKLIADFPEYAAYLPAITAKQLPAVIPAESRAKLSALGIPAK